MLPACGMPVPRIRRGIGSSPPRGHDVCQSCAESVGFRRRPRQSAYMRRKLATGETRNMGLDVRLALLEDRVAALEDGD